MFCPTVCSVMEGSPQRDHAPWPEALSTHWDPHFPLYISFLWFLPSLQFRYYCRLWVVLITVYIEYDLPFLIVLSHGSLIRSMIYFFLKLATYLEICFCTDSWQLLYPELRRVGLAMMRFECSALQWGYALNAHWLAVLCTFKWIYLEVTVLRLSSVDRTVIFTEKIMPQSMNTNVCGNTADFPQLFKKQQDQLLRCFFI